MKIVFAMLGTVRTGGTNAVFNIADCLALSGHEVVLVSLGAKEADWFKFKSNLNVVYVEGKYLRDLRVQKKRHSVLEILNYALRHRYFSFDRSKILASALDRYCKDADVVVATAFETALSVYRTSFTTPKKFYFIQHFESVFFEDQYDKRRVHETYFLPFNWIVNSSWAKSKLTELTGKTGNIVVPGIDHEAYFHKHVTKDEDNKVIVALGKSAKVKGLKYLFEALTLLSSKIRNIKLVLYGVEPDLKSKSPVQTDYILSPSNEELANIYSSADVVVTPSLYESSPSPPIEAMACGVPVVTTRFGTEDYCFDHENCLVVEPEDSLGLSEAIYNILTDNELAKELVVSGLATVKEMTWVNTAHNFEQFLKEATNLH